MRWTETLIPTLRESPKEAEAGSHKWLLRGGFIRQLASGVYSYLPLGQRVLQKVSQIIREEMSRAGAAEVLLPALHPAELWKKTGRYEALGGDKIAFQSRSGQEFVLGPTHEEVITELAAGSLKSYQDLPLILFQYPLGGGQGYPLSTLLKVIEAVPTVSAFCAETLTGPTVMPVTA